MLDKIVGTGVYKASVSEMKHEKDAEEYINLLRDRYKFIVFEFTKDGEFFLNSQLFKLIHIKPKSVIEKEKVLALFLAEKSNLIQKNREFLD